MIEGNAQAAALALMGGLRLKQDELESRTGQALDPAYWQHLAPFLSAGATGVIQGVAEQAALDDRGVADVAARIESDGYFQLAPLLSPTDVARMRAGIDALRQAGWPPAFAFVYDEFWQIARTPSLARLLTAVLGPGYRQNSDVWCHYVAPTTGSTGWRPHTDGANKPNRLSIWIPLSDATLDNGCMYVVPRQQLPEQLVGAADGTIVPWSDVRAALQGARALPAAAGSVLGWRFDIMHWGSIASRPAHPRISLAVEFVSTDVQVRHDEEPLLDGQGAFPDLRRRLHCIGKGILMYEQFEPVLIRFRDLAQRLTETS